MKKSFPLLISLLTVFSLLSCGQNNDGPNNDDPTPSILIEDGYSYHPTSEPHINKQLHTLSVLGDIYSVWDHYRGDGVKVAVIDTEFRITHEEFYYEDGTSKVSDDSAHLYKFNNKVYVEVGKDKAGLLDEGDWHGTMCAGLLGSAVNQKGTTGIAPNCSLMLLKVDRSPEAIAKAFEYAADNGAKVVSISLGQYPNSAGASYGDIRFPAGYDLTKAFQKSINYAYNKGVTIVSAVGNDSKTTLTYPAGCDNVIGAGGLSSGSSIYLWNEGWEGSNYNGSKVYVDCFAPSQGIYTPGAQSDSGYMSAAEAKGTSFAAPIIAGAAALYFQKYPTAKNSDFERDLANSCTDISQYNQNKDTGWGALNIGKLLNIQEDIEELEYQSSTTLNRKATKLKIASNSYGFSTFHVWGMKFANGYGYQDFENYMVNEYGDRILTSNFNVNNTSKGWAYTDEHFVGDYYIKTTNRDVIFPWWVNDLSFQVLNGSKWLPENGGYKLSSLNGKNKEVTLTPTSTSVSYQVGALFNIDMPAITVNLHHNGEIVQSDVSCVYDIYFPTIKEEKFFVDIELKCLYLKRILRKDFDIYF